MLKCERSQCERSHFLFSSAFYFEKQVNPVTKSKKRITIKDVAAQAGVSYQTVSRVINNDDHVTSKTRTKVQQTFEALNFRPSLAARSLPGRRSYVIGLIIPYEADYLFRDPHLLAQISGIDAEANAQGYNLLLSTAGNSTSGLEAYERFIRNQVADGALVYETINSQAGNELLIKQGYPFVSLGYPLNDSNAYFVHSDDRAGAREATHHLLEKGHRRIGIINGPPVGAVAALQHRLMGHQQALAEAGLSFDPTLIKHGDYTRPSGQVATEQLLALPDPPTAIFAFNDRMAMGAIRALNAANFRVPEDVAIVGFDDIPTAADFNPALTTVDQAAKSMGQIAAQMLFKRIAGEPIAEREVSLPARLIVRQSS
jgi:DNA-binding LacI/PurR family transcriptional regulator